VRRFDRLEVGDVDLGVVTEEAVTGEAFEIKDVWEQKRTLWLIERLF
jgi:hypothetical protein